MRNRVPVLAAMALAVVGFAGAANADIITSSVRIANSNLAGYDSILLFAKNDGLGATAGDQNIVAVNFTVTDSTSSGIVLGAYKSGTKFIGDPDGGKMGSNGAFSASNPVPTYGGTAYPADSSETGAQLYSWIGNGNFNGQGWSLADALPATGTGATTVAGSGYASRVSSLFVQGGWTTAVDASGETGGFGTGNGYLTVPDGKGAFIGVIVVPHNDVIAWTGSVFGGFGAPQNVSGSDPSGGPATPEPASLGVLALGSLALLARRRRVA